MDANLADEARKLFEAAGADVKSISSEEILCVNLMLREDSKEAHYAVYDAELDLRNKFPDIWIRISLD